MRFLHTADWQIGMRAGHAGARAGDIRKQRLETVRRIVELANERQVDFMLVAGDQFEDAAPARDEIANVVISLQGATMPIFVLPGNHDPSRTDSPYSAAAWNVLSGTQVVTVREPGAFDVIGGVLLAAPCEKRHSMIDPTAGFAAMPSPDGAIRIGCAHGTLQLGHIKTGDEGDQRGGYPIALDAASRAGLTYLALGHWHSRFEYPDASALIAYSGTPEPTRFGETDSGSVCIVEIDGPGATPRVEAVRVAGLTWHEPAFEVFDAASYAHAITALEAIPDAARAVVKASFRGVLPPDEFEQAEVARDSFRQRFFAYEEQDDVELRPGSAAAWVRAFDHILAREVAAELVEKLDGEQRDVALRALVQLRAVSR